MCEMDINSYDMKRLVDALENGAKALTALAYERKRANDFAFGTGRQAARAVAASSPKAYRQGWGQPDD